MFQQLHKDMQTSISLQILITNKLAKLFLTISAESRLKRIKILGLKI
jgi:hypothetical protein